MTKKIRFRSKQPIRYVYLVKDIRAAMHVYDGNTSAVGIKPVPLRMFKGWSLVEYEVDAVDYNKKTGKSYPYTFSKTGGFLVNGERWAIWMAPDNIFEVVS